jgi:hypothetical protein
MPNIFSSVLFDLSDGIFLFLFIQSIKDQYFYTIYVAVYFLTFKTNINYFLKN